MPTHSTLLYVADDPSVDLPSDMRLAGLPIAERVVRAGMRAGYDNIIVFAPTTLLGSVADPRVQITRSAADWKRALASVRSDSLVTAIGPGTVVSTTLLRNAMRVTATSTAALNVPAGPSYPISGVIRTSVEAARNVGRLAATLITCAGQSEQRPSGEEVSQGRAQLALRITSPSSLAEAEQTIRRATYKQTDAKLARFNRCVSLPISIALLRTPVTANMMSLFVLALGLWSAWLFSRGEYLAGILGGLLSLASSILDGCDGEIARLKYQESSLGCWLETIGDYSYYLAIFIGLTIGAVRQTGSTVFQVLGAIGLAGTMISFVLLIFLRRRITDGRPETLHAVARTRFKADPSWWSAIVWRVSFVATRAAMPYGIASLALMNVLPLVVALLAVGANVYWVSLVLKLRDLVGTAPEVGERQARATRLAPQS